MIYVVIAIGVIKLIQEVIIELLNKPILTDITSFDANKPKTFRFTIRAGGPQIVKNKLIIRRQEDNVIVYQEIQETFKYEHKFPGNIFGIVNGQYYNASIIVYDAFGDSSPESFPVQFRCYTTPVIEFTNIPGNNIINNSSYNFNFTYSQQEGEILNSYVINLYNTSKLLIGSSGVVYVENGMPPYDGSYLFSGFEDNTTYLIEVLGETVNRTLVESQLSRIEVKYEKPDLFTLVSLKNNCEKGFISITSNIVLIEGEGYPDPPIFLNDTEIDLTENGSYVGWKKGYVINGDFLARSWFRKPNLYSVITQFSNAQGQIIKIEFMEGYENIEAQNKKVFVQMTISTIEGYSYYIYSNYIEKLTDSQYYNYQIRRKNETYQIELNSVG